MQFLKAYMVHEDERGLICGITQDQWHEVNYVETCAGGIRGGHYHKETRELFYILEGVVDVTIINTQPCAETAVTALAGSILVIEPYEYHTFSVPVATRWINMLSKSHNPLQPDFYNL